MVNWSNPSDKISKYFTVKEACWLPSWGIMHVPSEAEKANIMKMAAIMDVIREKVGKPISVHCWIRPTSVNCPGSAHHGGNYNLAIGSTALHSAHIIGKAVDWDCGTNCDDVRTLLAPQLEAMGLRMEKMPGGNWVHNDCADVPPGGVRYFIP